MKDSARRVMFIFWGRRGAMVPFSIGVQQAAMTLPQVEPFISVSRQNEAFDDYHQFGDRLVPVNTYSRGFAALTGIWRAPTLSRYLIKEIKRHDIEAVINLMPHVWTPYLAWRLGKAGIHYTTVIHDADAHPGDKTAIMNSYLLREAHHAEKVITLSASVRDKLVTAELSKPERTKVLFHPDFNNISTTSADRFAPGRPLRLLFFGRIYAYKGLGLFVEACEILRAKGIAIQVGVFGEGDMSAYHDRLLTLKAEIENRWIAESEIPDILARFDAMALSYVEASQSGVAALGFGAGLPAVATPIGGLTEQVVDGQTGVLAEAVTANAFAEAVAKLATDDDLYRTITLNLASTSQSRSMARFVDEAVAFALD